MGGGSFLLAGDFFFSLFLAQLVFSTFSKLDGSLGSIFELLLVQDLDCVVENILIDLILPNPNDLKKQNK